jgi:hypothetical protein
VCRLYHALPTREPVDKVIHTSDPSEGYGALVSLWDEIRDGAHALYETDVEFTNGFRDILPSFVQVLGVPIPIDAFLAGAFGTGLRPSVSAEYWEAFAINLANTAGGTAAVNGLTSLGRASQAAGTGQDSMPALIIANTYRVAIKATSSGLPVLNVVGVRGTAGGQEAAAAAAVKAAWETGATSLLNQHTNNYHMVSYDATDLTTATGGIASVASTGVGSFTAETSTAAACALFKFMGGTRQRSSNGRMYYGPIDQNSVNTDGRSLEAAAKTALTTALTAFVTSLNTAGFPLVVISRHLSSAHLVSTYLVESTIATQRRRIGR